MSELEKMFAINLDFQQRIYKNFSNFSLKQKQQLTKDYVLHCISECCELLQSIQWKTWTDREKKFAITQLVDELVDAQKFLINIALIWNIDYKKYFSMFEKKSEVNLQRYAQKELLKEKNPKICAWDLDGVIYPFPESFIKFVNDKLHSRYKISNSLSPAIPSMKADKYFALKDEYRERFGEIYKNPKPIAGSVECLRKLRAMGYKIIILSARPYREYPNIFINTLLWLRRNKVPFDFVYWDKNKSEKIIKEFPKLEFIVEDNLKEAESIADVGVKCYLLDRLYNKSIVSAANIKRVDNLKEILCHLENTCTKRTSKK